MKKLFPSLQTGVVSLYLVLAVLLVSFRDQLPVGQDLFGSRFHLGELIFLLLSLMTLVVFILSELRQQSAEARYRVLAEATSDAVFLVKGLRIVECNPQAVRLFGVAKNQILSQPFPPFSPPRQEDGRLSEDAGRAYARSAYTGENLVYNWQHVRPQGKPFDALVSVKQLLVRGEDHLMVVVRDLSQQQEHQEMLRKNSEQRRIMLEASQSVVGTLSLDEVISRILSSLHDIVDSESCALFHQDPQTHRTYVYKGAFKEDLREIMQSWSMPEGAGIVGAAFQKQEAILVNNAHFDPRSIYPSGRPSVDHVIAIPLMAEGKLLGVFNVNRRTPAPFSEEEFELVNIFSNYAAQAIHNAALYQESHQQVEWMSRLSVLSETLNQPFSLDEVTSAIGNGIIHLVDADRAIVFLVDPDTRVTCRWSKNISRPFENWIQEHIGKMLESGSVQDVENLHVRSLADFDDQAPFKRILVDEGAQAMSAYPLIYENRLVGAIVCMFDSLHSWGTAERDLVRTFGRHAAIALENVRLYEELQHSFMETVLTLARAVDARDTYTGDHSSRLAEWSVGMAKRLGCSEQQVQDIHWATILHDIGKIGIPDAILNKPGPLDDAEWVVMKRHPEIGAGILAPVKKLERVAPIVHAHHEKFDGSGYPLGLAGEEIPLASRILKVADAYCAMIDQRVYRPARPADEALAEILRCSGTDFDPVVVNTFLEILNGEPDQTVFQVSSLDWEETSASSD